MDNDLQNKVTVGGELPYKGPMQYGVPKMMVFFTQLLKDGDKKEVVADELYSLVKDRLPVWAGDMEQLINKPKEVKSTPSVDIEKLQIEMDKKYTDLIKRAKDAMEARDAEIKELKSKLGIQ